MLKDLLRKGDYLIKIDLKDAYLTVCVLDPSKISTLPVEEHSAKVCLPSIWASHYSQGFHQTYEACSSHAETKGSAPNYLFIRHADHGRVSQPGTSPCSHSSESTRKSGVCYQLQEVSADFKSEFLGFLIDSVALSLQLPGEKWRKIRKQCQKLLNLGEVSIRELSKFLGLLTSSFQAVFPAPLHYRQLDRLKNHSLNTLQSYDATIPLDSLEKEELVWWRDHLQAWNGKALFQSSVDLVIETDASRNGWGVVLRRSKYRGPMVYRRTEVSHKLSRTPCRVLCHQNLL